MDTGNHLGERINPDFATAPGDEKYKYRRSCGPIYIVDCPRVAVCKDCCCIVADPSSHMQTQHNVKVAKNFFPLRLAERRVELVTEKDGRMAQLPFVEVKEDGSCAPAVALAALSIRASSVRVGTRQVEGSCRKFLSMSSPLARRAWSCSLSGASAVSTP